jgi:hypothetical protein
MRSLRDRWEDSPDWVGWAVIAVINAIPFGIYLMTGDDPYFWGGSSSLWRGSG